MKLHTITDNLKKFGRQLTEEYRHLDQQPYCNFVKHSNWFLFGSLFYMIQMLLVCIIAVYGADQFITATGSLWLKGIMYICAILFKTFVIMMIGLVGYSIITYCVFGPSYRERKKLRGET